MDKRTRKGQEELILDHIRKYGGFSVFWVTGNQRRAQAAERLEKSGVITVTPVNFPIYKAVINAKTSN